MLVFRAFACFMLLRGSGVTQRLSFRDSHEQCPQFFRVTVGVRIPFLFKLKKSALYVVTTSCLSIHVSVDTRVLSTSQLL